MPITLIDEIPSKVDRTIKYVFRLGDQLITEIAYIDNHTGKDILCVSTQTGCRLKCKFCHMTDAYGKIVCRNLTSEEIFKTVKYVYEQKQLADNNRMLLISYMGCGEPLFNYVNVYESMRQIRSQFDPFHKHDKYSCRFAIATLFPHSVWCNFFYLCQQIKLFRLPVKIHLSLHFTDDAIRREWMPSALEIRPAITALEFYQKLTGNSVEIHYTPIEGVNDQDDSALKLSDLLKNRKIPVKLLRYNKRPSQNHEPSGNVQRFMDILLNEGIACEYYDPPGSDVGASCGEFLLDYYLRYNTRQC